MRNRITDLVGVLATGLLLTALLAGTPWLLRQLEISSAFFANHAVQFILYLGCLFIPPLLAAFYSAKRTSFNPFLAGIATCLIPALAYFAFMFAINVYTKVTLDDGHTFLNILGYVDPHDLAGNLRMAARPCVWALIIGSGGGAICFFVKRKNASKAVEATG